MGDEDIMFICWPPSMLGEVTPGSKIRHCRVCLGEIWVAKSTFAEIKKRKIRDPKLWCVPCVHREARKGGQNAGKVVETLPPTPEQIAEIAEHLRRSKH